MHSLNSFRNLVGSIFADSELSVLKQYNLLIVHHMLGTHHDFYQLLSELFFEVEFIAIPYSIDVKTLSGFKERNNGIKLQLLDNLSDMRQVVDLTLDKLLNSEKKIVIIDVGGYSAAKLLSLDAENLGKIVGVVEDTENGYRVFNDIMHDGRLKWNTFSVARSSLKTPEDAMTGDAVAFSVDKMIRTLNQTMNNMNVLVIGYGRIGSSLAQSLTNRKANVTVFDSNPVKLIEAHSHGFTVKEKHDAIKTSDLIIGATGCNSISDYDFRNMSNGTILASASSKQIEYDVSCLVRSSSKIRHISETINIYEYEGKSLILLNNGYPINFIDNGIIGNYLYLVWCEILASVLMLTKAAVKSNCINEVDNEMKIEIASSWLRIFVYGK